MNKVCYTAIFGEYEELKEPTVITPNWRYVCFTDQPFKSDVWEIVNQFKLYEDKLLARYTKIRGFKVLSEEFSMWVDGSFTIACDLNEWWEKHFKAPFTCIDHPIRDCFYAEADACIRHGRGSAEEITPQVEKYRQRGLPAHNGIISSGILMRQNCKLVREFCDNWFLEVEKNSSRDQLAFAYIAWIAPIFHTFKWDYRQRKDFIFLTHYNRRKTPHSF